jgi:hypothetical protein
MGVDREQNRHSPEQRGSPSGARVRVRRVVPTQIIPSLAGRRGSLAPDAAPSGALQQHGGPDGADAHCLSHEHAEERLPTAVVMVVVACAGVSVRDFPIAEMNEPRAALPPGEVSVAS